MKQEKRREFLKKMGISFVSLTYLPLESISFHSSEYSLNNANRSSIIIAFVRTILPGLKKDNPVIAYHFYDKQLKIKKLEFLLKLFLKRITKRTYGHNHFDRLDLRSRKNVIYIGLNGSNLRKKIFTGAIFLTQVAIYCAIYNRPNLHQLYYNPKNQGIIDSTASYHYSYLEGNGAKSATKNGNYD